MALANGEDLVEVPPPIKLIDNTQIQLEKSNDELLAERQDNSDDQYWLRGNHFEGDIVTTYENIEKHFGHEAAENALKRGAVAQMATKDDDYYDEYEKNETNNRILTLNSDPNELWKTRDSNNKIVIPYVIANSYTLSERAIIIGALTDLASKTGVFSFVSKTSQTDAISFVKSGTGCYSQVGRQGGVQVISIDTPGCLTYGTIQHETLHSIGFWHEQSRKDRNSYVAINYDNVINGHEHNFNIQQDSIDGDLGSPYDYSSVMHYSSTAFGKQASVCSKSTPVCNKVVTISFKGNGQDGNSQYCLDVKNGQSSLYDGQPIQLYTCGALSYTNQLWFIEPWGIRGSVFRLAKNRDYCLTMEFKSTSNQNYAKLVLSKCGTPSPNMSQIFGIFGNDWSSNLIRWEGDNKYCMDRIAPNSNAASFNGQNMQLYTCGALNYANQYFKFTFFSQTTNICNQINAWCSLSNFNLQTINSNGNAIGKTVVSSQDILRARLMYKCSTPRNLKDFCSSDCKCKNGEGNCKTNNDCESGLTCTNAGSINVCKPSVGTKSPTTKSPTKEPTLFNNCVVDGVPETCGCNKVIKVQRPGCQSEQMYICSTDSTYSKVKIGNFDYCKSFNYWKPLLGEGFCSDSTDKAHSLAFYTGSEYKYITGYDGSGWFYTSKTIDTSYTAKIGGKLNKWFTKGGSSPIYLSPNIKSCSTLSWYVVQKNSLTSGLIYPNYEVSGDIEYGCACPYAF